MYIKKIISILIYKRSIFSFSYGEQSTIAAILDGVSQHLSTTELVDKFEKFITNHKENFKSIQTSLENSLRIAKYELGWYSSHSTSITKWLQTFDELAFRLPTNISPQKYSISITPYLDGNFTVDGKVTIEADIKQPTSQIILHSSEIEHHEVNVMADQRKMNILEKMVIDQHDFYVITLAKKLTIGTKLTIEIKYTSHLNATEHRGFYKSSYVNEKGETRYTFNLHQAS